MPKLVLPNDVLLPEVCGLLRQGLRVELMTRGNSMLPFIVGDRDSVVLVQTPAVGVGDIVLAQIHPGHFVLHRVRSIEDGVVTLQGDGNLRGTENCRIEDVCGTAVRILKPRREVDCNDARFRRRARRWMALPYIVRRYYLAIYRRLI